VSAVIKKDPAFAPAYYNLGIFYQAQGFNDLAVVAYQKFLALDPTGKQGNADYVKQQLKALGAPESASGGSSIATGSAPTTP
jgi:tetratricopeptide (TPR) repeat protein